MSNKIYHSKVDSLTNWVLWGSVLVGFFTIIPILSTDSFWFRFGMLSMLSLFIGLLISVRYNTYYFFTESEMIWVTGPFKGKINLSKVVKISKAKSWTDISAGTKPILSRKCLLIRYSKYDDLPVSPEREQEFIQEMIQINPNIKLELASASDLYEEKSSS